MNFNSKINFDINFKKVLIGVIILILCLVVGIVIYLSTRSIEEPVVEEPPNREPVIDTNPIITEPVEIEQDDAVSRLIAVVTDVRDLSTRVEYEVEVGLGESATSSVVKANSLTTFVDLESKKLMNPSDVTEGSILVLYATGKYTVGNLSAEVIGLGDNTSYNYGKIEAINSNGENSYIWTLSNSVDKVVVDSECVVIDAFTGSELQHLGLVQLEEKILFKGTLVNTNIGSVYNCTEIIRLGE